MKRKRSSQNASETPGLPGLTGGAVAPFTGAWIETKMDEAEPTSSARSHPLRVRGLKPVRQSRRYKFSGSHPLRVRGLKRRKEMGRRRHGWSHPLRVRGLKHNVSSHVVDGDGVAPFTGATGSEQDRMSGYPAYSRTGRKFPPEKSRNRSRPWTTVSAQSLTRDKTTVSRPLS